MKTPIQISVKKYGLVSQVEKITYEFRNLMILLRDNFLIDGLGGCDGVDVMLVL